MWRAENFKIEEFISEGDLRYLERVGWDFVIKENIHKLAVLLQKIRVPQKVIYITSGYRNRLKNEKVGGAKNSLHLWGMACDFIASEINVDELYKLYINEQIGEFIVYTKQSDRKYIRYHLSLPCYELEKVGVLMKAEEGVKNYERVDFDEIVRTILRVKNAVGVGV